jgi:hypothetical protein
MRTGNWELATDLPKEKGPENPRPSFAYSNEQPYFL